MKGQKHMINETIVKNYRYTDEKTQNIYDVTIYPELAKVVMHSKKDGFFSVDFGNTNVMSLFASATKEGLLRKMNIKPNVFNLSKSKEITNVLLETIAIRLGLEEIEYKPIVNMINNSRCQTGLEFTKCCYNHIRAFNTKLFEHIKDVVYVYYDYPDSALKLVDIIIHHIRPLLPKAPLHFEERIICDCVSKNGPNLYGNDITTPLNKRMIMINNLYLWLYKEGILEKISFEYKDYDDATFFAFDAADLVPYVNNIVNSGIESAADALNLILFDKIQPCVFSGTRQPGCRMTTYRNNNGCVGRSHECELIQYLETGAASVVYGIKNEYNPRMATNILFRISMFDPTT
jgi:hypothetical protein